MTTDRLSWPIVQPTLTAAQLTLRPWHDTDVEDICEACQDPAIARYTQVPVPYLATDARSFLVSCRESWRVGAGAVFGITSPESDRLLGSCGLVDVDRALAVASIGYWVAPWARRQGVATGALQAISEWALDDLGFGRVELEIEPENAASLGVAIAAGFDPDEVAGMRRNLIKGVERDFVVLFREPSANA